MLDGLGYYRIFGFPVMMYIGILSFLFLLSTALSALRMKHGRLSMKWHHRMVVITLIVAGVHGMMGLLSEGVGTSIEGTGMSQNPAEPGDIIYGRKIFRENCIQCHPKRGNVITPAKPLRGSATLKDFDTFRSFLRNARGMMPSFSSKQISDEEAMTLYHYLISDQNFD